MLKRWSIGSLVIALVVLMAVPAALACKKTTDRPFNATLRGEAHWEYPGHFRSKCATVTTVTESVGRVNGMGRVSSFWSHCPNEDSKHEPNDGRVTFVFANGDKLNGRYDYPAIDDGSPIRFTGGTGQFARASGSATVTYDVVPVLVDEDRWSEVGCVDPEQDFACLDFTVPWKWTAKLKGTISY